MPALLRLVLAAMAATVAGTPFPAEATGPVRPAVVRTLALPAASYLVRRFDGAPEPRVRVTFGAATPGAVPYLPASHGLYAWRYGLYRPWYGYGAFYGYRAWYGAAYTPWYGWSLGRFYGLGQPWQGPMWQGLPYGAWPYGIGYGPPPAWHAPPPVEPYQGGDHYYY